MVKTLKGQRCWVGEASAVGGGAFCAKGAAEAKTWTSRRGEQRQGWEASWRVSYDTA